MLLFRRRAWPAWVGLGFGAGRGYAECDADFKNGSRGVGRAGERIVRSLKEKKENLDCLCYDCCLVAIENWGGGGSLKRKQPSGVTYPNLGAHLCAFLKHPFVDAGHASMG